DISHFGDRSLRRGSVNSWRETVIERRKWLRRRRATRIQLKQISKVPFRVPVRAVIFPSFDQPALLPSDAGLCFGARQRDPRPGRRKKTFGWALPRKQLPAKVSFPASRYES